MRGTRLLRAGLAVVFFAALPGAADPDGVVLDWERSYWRYHLTCRPPKYSAPFKDRKGRTFEHLSYVRGWHIAAMEGRVHTPDSPADWVKPDFDDSSWPRERKPEAGSEKYEPAVRVKRLRGRFQVPDPGRVSNLSLEIEYVGGVAVYLNGREVARSHLPQGALNADVIAEGYPEEAYVEPGAQWGMGEESNPQRLPTPKALALRNRRLAVHLPPSLLTRGTNVLAVSAHQSAYHPYAATWSWECGGMGGNLATWPHLVLRSLKLVSSPALVAPSRPAGVQVWVDDIHRRVVNRDWNDESDGTPVLRIVGVRNGIHSGQVVVGTSAPLTGLSATVGELTREGGAGKIPSDALQVRFASGIPVANLQESVFNKHNQFFSEPANRIIERYGSARFKDWNDVVKPRAEIFAAAQALSLFDQLAEQPPQVVPADSAQPVWLTVKVPRDAPAGEYRGTLRVRAGGDKTVEVRIFVVDWILPDLKDGSSFVGLQHSLWGACTQYKVAPWSEEHWLHLESSMEWLAGVGNDLAVLPLVCQAEEANAESLVPWIPKGDGYDYDWKVLDRYLDLVAKHWGKKVAVVGEICWTPYTAKGWEFRHPSVSLAGGKKPLPLPPPSSEEWKKLFPPFARAVHERVKAKGFVSFYWGWFYDSVPPELGVMADALAVAAPGAGWARASHYGFDKKPFPKGSQAPTLDMHIRAFPQSFNSAGEPESRQGWKAPGNVLFPRHASQIMAIGPVESPMSMRWLVENCLVNGAAGFGRIGADYWPPFEFKIWYHPFVHYLLHPGPKRAESGIRFEALREGLQEAEARIWLEKAGKDQAEPAKSVLADRIRLLGAVPTGPAFPLMGEHYGGWQERSWNLYAAVAEASGGKAPTPGEQARFLAAGVRR